MLEQIISIVREAGEIVLSAHDVWSQTHEKSSAADLVTEYDLAVERFLKGKLPPLVPGSLFFGEEEKENASPLTGWVFIVDPIDGTTNFVRGLKHSAISVALAHDGAMEYGVVYDPYKDEIFSAKRDGGAFLNGRPVRVSERPLDQGVFGMGTAIYDRQFIAPTMRLTEQLFRRSCDFRRLGAAALDLCGVACGRLDLFFEYSLSPWDHAAGGLILIEAGGVLSTLEGRPMDYTRRCSVWASNRVNGDILRELEV